MTNQKMVPLDALVTWLDSIKDLTTVEEITGKVKQLAVDVPAREWLPIEDAVDDDADYLWLVDGECVVGMLSDTETWGATLFQHLPNPPTEAQL